MIIRLKQNVIELQSLLKAWILSVKMPSKIIIVHRISFSLALGKKRRKKRNCNKKKSTIRTKTWMKAALVIYSATRNKKLSRVPSLLSHSDHLKIVPKIPNILQTNSLLKAYNTKRFSTSSKQLRRRILPTISTNKRSAKSNFQTEWIALIVIARTLIQLRAMIKAEIIFSLRAW